MERGLGSQRGLITLIHHQGIICCVAFDRSSLRRIAHTPQLSLLPQKSAGSSIVALASNTLLVIRDMHKPPDLNEHTQIRRWILVPFASGFFTSPVNGIKKGELLYNEILVDFSFNTKDYGKNLCYANSISFELRQGF